MKPFVVVPGEPVAKPRMSRADVWKKRTCVVEYRSWCDVARESLGISRDAKIDAQSQGIKGMRIIFVFSVPQSTSAKKAKMLAGFPHQVRPDLDNCIKSVMDAIFIDDNFISAVYAEKRYCSEGEEPHTRIWLDREQKKALQADDIRPESSHAYSDRGSDCENQEVSGSPPTEGRDEADIRPFELHQENAQRGHIDGPKFSRFKERRDQEKS